MKTKQSPNKNAYKADLMGAKRDEKRNNAYRKLGKILIASSLVVAVGGSLSLYLINKHEKSGRIYTQNWSGNYVAGSGLSHISASWTVPKVDGNRPGVSSAWIGIGGLYGKDRIIQIGTEQNCVPESGSSGCTTQYYSVWEAYPENFAQVISEIRPGDRISASVDEISPGNWMLSMQNFTENITFSRKVVFNADQNSAEAIVELPQYKQTGEAYSKLADFGSIKFYGVEANSGNGPLEPSLFAQVLMYGSTYCTPSKMSGSGSFYVTWHGTGLK